MHGIAIWRSIVLLAGNIALFWKVSQWISERKIQFCPVAPCSNDRVLFASMLQVFIASMNKRKQHFWLTEDFILSPSSTASSRAPYIKRYGMFCQGKHIVPLKNVVLLNPSTASTQILSNCSFRDNSAACLYASFLEKDAIYYICSFLWKEDGIPCSEENYTNRATTSRKSEIRPCCSGN